ESRRGPSRTEVLLDGELDICQFALQRPRDLPLPVQLLDVIAEAGDEVPSRALVLHAEEQIRDMLRSPSPFRVPQHHAVTPELSKFQIGAPRKYLGEDCEFVF